MRVVWLTNDLPPRAGGIQQFVANLLERVVPEHTVVVGPAERGAADHDRAQPYRVVRAPGAILPTPRTLALTRQVARRHRPDVVVLGASWPLGHLADALRREPGVPVVALSHGLEAGLCGVGLGWLLRRATRALDTVTTISDFTERAMSPHLRADRVERLPPGVDVDRFRPGLDGTHLRTRWGVPPDAPLVGCVSRLVRRKGQDRLVEVWPQLQRRHPDAWLVLVGSGPLEDELRDRAAGLRQVVVAGGVPWDELAHAHAALDVFAMPCRTRLAGTDVEGLGIVYLEAQACAVPVIAGRSGGAPEALREGETGVSVDGRDPAALVDALDQLLADPDRRRVMGRAGRAWVEKAWSWDHLARRFERILRDVSS